MKQRALAVAVAFVAVAVLFSGRTPLTLTIAGVAFSTAVLILLTSFDRGRTAATIRLDWFMPFLVRLQEGEQAAPTLCGRLLRRVIPKQMQSNRTTKKRGVVRRGLRRLGLSWVASPVRRLIQACCLLLFIGLLFYVCWPYSAKPEPPGHVSDGWVFKGNDQQSGALIFEGTLEDQWNLRASENVFVFAQSASSTEGASGLFRVETLAAADIRLQPKDELTPELLDAFYTSNGPWTICEKDPTAWPSHHANNLARKEVLPAEMFLMLDPLVSLSTAVASRSWVWSLVSAGCILVVCVLVPRGFCGYLCPLGTTIDLFDWAFSGRVRRFRTPDNGWWVHIKYYLLAGTMICALLGVLVSGFFSAIPVITRAMLFLFEPLQTGTMRGWHQIPTMNAGHLLSLLLFFVVLSLGFLRPRFWCKYVCPSGAVFSIGNLLRATERKVEASCIDCNKCIEICPFDAIKPDFTTRTTDCTMCQSCGGVCPTHAIKFVDRWNNVDIKLENDPPTGETTIGRRGFLSLAGGTAAAVAGGVGIASLTKSLGADLDGSGFRPVRPPGSVPEQEFLEMCIRCGECFKVCPNDVLQLEAFQQGLEGLWTPMVVANWAGCESSCNACGQVCPTGAIRALPLDEKRFARMGLAIVNEKTCLPYAGKEACDLCVQECNAAGYNAIEFMHVGTEVDNEGQPMEGTGYVAPVVLEDKCVGCGLCQTRCYAINVKDKSLLHKSAIIIETGEGKEDRMMTGSYAELRQQEAKSRTADKPAGDFFVPEEGEPTSPLEDPDGEDIEPDSDDNPFG